MPATVSHQLSATTPDDPAYEIRPSHWNQSHALTLNAVGSEISGAFGNGGGVTFGLSADGKVTASAPAAAPSPVNFSAGTTSNDLGAVVFSNSNGLAFGLNGSTITGSYTQSTHSHATAAYSGSNGSFTAATVTFGSSNGMHFYTTNGSIVGSYTVPTVPAQFSGGLSNGGNTAGDTGVVTGRVVFAGGNNITVSGSTNAGSMTVTISGPNTVAQSNQTVGLYGLGNTTQNSSTTLDARTLSFNGLGGMTVGYSNGSIQLSAPQTVAQSNQTLGLYAVGNTTGQSSSSTFDARTVSFVGQGIASVGFSNGSVNISVPSGGGGLTNINVSAGTTSQNLSNVVFSDSNGVSFGLNGSTITASVAGAEFTHSGFRPYQDRMYVVGNAFSSPANMHVNPVQFPNAVQFDAVVFPLHRSNASNSTGSATVSLGLGLYSRNGSTLSRVWSTSSSFGLTFHGTVSSWSLHSGIRNYVINAFTTTITKGDYWAVHYYSTATGGANHTLQNMRVSMTATDFAGRFGSAVNTSNQVTLGLGYVSYSNSNSILNASIAFSQIQGQISQNHSGPPIYQLVSGYL